MLSSDYVLIDKQHSIKYISEELEHVLRRHFNEHIPYNAQAACDPRFLQCFVQGNPLNHKFKHHLGSNTTILGVFCDVTKYGHYITSDNKRTIIVTPDYFYDFKTKQDLRRSVRIEDIIGVTVSRQAGATEFVIHLIDIKQWDLRFKSNL